MNNGELITQAFTLLGQGRFEAAEVHFGRYLAARVQVCGSEPLREAWQTEVAAMRRLPADREREERERAGRGGGGLWGMLSRR